MFKISKQNLYNSNQLDIQSVTCEALTDPADGSYVLHTNGTTTFASLNCTYDNASLHATDIECTLNGTWKVEDQNQECGKSMVHWRSYNFFLESQKN